MGFWCESSSIYDVACLQTCQEEIMLRITLAACVIALGSAMELTPDNWDEETSGKTVFIKVSFSL